MAQNTQNQSLSFNIGLPGLLFLLFTTLKLTGVISWSWWWVTAPLWISPLLIILIVALGLIFVSQHK